MLQIQFLSFFFVLFRDGITFEVKIHPGYYVMHKEANMNIKRRVGECVLHGSSL